MKPKDNYILNINQIMRVTTTINSAISEDTLHGTANEYVTSSLIEKKNKNKKRDLLTLHGQ